jgi:hypothetical protein
MRAPRRDPRAGSYASRSFDECCGDGLTRPADFKARQASKIKELGDALVAAGFCTLDRQASALGLSRSTTWTVLRAHHKHSGLSATIIKQMLQAPQLPPLVRTKIVEYINEKTSGLYGHREIQRRKFANRLALEHIGDPRKLEGKLKSTPTRSASPSASQDNPRVERASRRH